MLELGERRPSVLARKLGHLCAGACLTVFVDDDPAGDRERPGAEMVAVAKRGVRAQSPQKGLLERILCPVSAELANEEGEHLVAVLLVEALERWKGHVAIL